MKSENSKGKIFSFRKKQTCLLGTWNKGNWNQIYHQENWMGWNGWMIKDNGAIYSQISKENDFFFFF